MNRILVGVLIVLTIACVAPLQADDVKIVDEPRNVVASEYLGQWVVQEAMTRRLTVDRDGESPETPSVKLQFTYDSRVLDDLPEAYRTLFAQQTVYSAGRMRLSGRLYTYVIVESYGNPTLVWFDTSGEQTAANRCAIFVARAGERDNDLLFIGKLTKDRPFTAFERADRDPIFGAAVQGKTNAANTSVLVQAASPQAERAPGFSVGSVSPYDLPAADVGFKTTRVEAGASSFEEGNPTVSQDVEMTADVIDRPASTVAPDGLVAAEQQPVRQAITTSGKNDTATSPATEQVDYDALVATVMMVNDQIDVAMMTHGFVYPDLVGRQWEPLLKRTRGNATYSLPENPEEFAYGPFLEEAPVNPMTGSHRVVDRYDPTAGWLYNREQGKVLAIVPSQFDTGRAQMLVDVCVTPE
jgi:hypothetical protein